MVKRFMNIGLVQEKIGLIVKRNVHLMEQRAAQLYTDVDLLLEMASTHIRLKK